MKTPPRLSLEDYRSHSASSHLELVLFSSPLFAGTAIQRNRLAALPPDFERFLQILEVSIRPEDEHIIHRLALNRLPTLVLYLNAEEVERVEILSEFSVLEQWLRDAVSYYLPPHLALKQE